MKSSSLLVSMAVTPFLCSLLLVVHAARGNGGFLDEEEESERQLRILNKTPAKSIMYTREGDIIDCVDIYDQPAFDHPSLKRHEIQLAPSVVLSRDIDTAKNVSYKLLEPCPSNTVPIPRVRKEDLVIGRSLSRAPSDPSNNQDHDSSDLIDFSRIFWSDGESAVEHGGGAALTTHSLSVTRDRFTSLNLWVQNNASVIGAGWMVDQSSDGHGLTRFFTYWTGDNHHRDGCYNMNCPGFVQISSEITLNAVIFPASICEGEQFGVQIIVLQDPPTRHWWLLYDGNAVGYWPKELFKHLRDGATLQAWGGVPESESPGAYGLSAPM